jgi:ABC-2 type transport system permease protein
MRNALLIAWREYAANASTKGFWIGLLIVPLIILMSVQIPMWLEKKGRATRQFVLIDHTGRYAPPIQAALIRRDIERERGELRSHALGAAQPGRETEIQVVIAAHGKAGDKAESRIQETESKLRPLLRADVPAFKPGRPEFAIAEPPVALEAGMDSEAAFEAYRPWLKGDKKLGDTTLHAVLYIPKEAAPRLGGGEPEKSRSAQYWSVNLADESVRNFLKPVLNREAQQLELVTRGLDVGAVTQAMGATLPVVELNPAKDQGRERVGTMDKVNQWLPSAFVYLLWISLFSIIQMLLNNMIEEKSNRLIEVLLSSVTPGELMMGKLAGIAAVGLTLVGTWIISGIVILIAMARPEMKMAGQIVTTLQSGNLLPAFVFYFIMGYLMYAGLILAIGSVCNNIKEAQNYMGLITMLLMVPLFTMTFIPRDPHGTVATALSWIPIYTPFIMLNRIAADPPAFEVVGTMVLAMATAFLSLWGSVKVFRIGILQTGQPPKFTQMLRWIFHDPKKN